MHPKDLNKLAPLIKDFHAWSAFLVLLEFYENKCMAELEGRVDAEELYRINGKYMLIQQMKKARDTWLSVADKGMS